MLSDLPELIFHHRYMLFYGVLAGGALAALWHNRPMRPLGITIVLAWMLSNAIHLGLSFEWRPIAYPLIDLMIALVARQMWHRTGYKIAVVVVALSIMNCMANVSYSIPVLKHYPKIPDSVKDFHTIATNVIFGIKCASLILWGLVDAYGWLYNFGHLHGTGRRDPQLHSRRETNGE